MADIFYFPLLKMYFLDLNINFVQIKYYIFKNIDLRKTKIVEPFNFIICFDVILYNMQIRADTNR